MRLDCRDSSAAADAVNLGAGAFPPRPLFFGEENPMKNDFGLSKMDQLKTEAQMIFCRAYPRGYPLGQIRRMILTRFTDAGVLPPADVMAYAMPGLSDCMISDWDSGLDTSKQWLKKLDF